MNRIDFYILPSDTPEARWHFVGRLADKAARLGHRVLIAVDSAEQAQLLAPLAATGGQFPASPASE